ncbi:hypothetical protein RRG08_053455 [Elysia crispata]|uniref:Uncharacterized protein n=1 Tax=Elysia crispata TaxID=231223 RepID=A0AAE0XNG6_9GAST|nr:hypothetical protein RRG08_053455 [Elysia crispata]
MFRRPTRSLLPSKANNNNYSDPEFQARREKMRSSTKRHFDKAGKILPKLWPRKRNYRPQVELSRSPNLNELPDSPNLPYQRSAGIRSDTRTRYTTRSGRVERKTNLICTAISLHALFRQRSGR